MTLFNYDEQLLKDFLSWCGREHGAVLTDITRPDVEHRRMYKYLKHPDLIEQFINLREEVEE